MPTINLELDNKARQDGRHSILLRLTIDRKKSRYTPNIYVKKSDFNSKAKFGKWIRTSEYEHQQINERLKVEILKLDKFVKSYLDERPETSPAEVMKMYKNKQTENGTWLKYFAAVVSHYEAINKFSYSIRINAIFNKLKDHLGAFDVSLNKTNIEFVRSFEEYLYSLGNSRNTVAVNLKVIKQVYRQAVRDGHVDTPNLEVLEYPTPSDEVERDKFTEEEISEILKLELVEGSAMWHARNYFMFSYYMAGIRFGDFVRLRWSNILEGEYLRYRMSKTSKLQKLRLVNQAKEVLELYRTDKPREDGFIWSLLPLDFDKLAPKEQIKVANAKNSLVNNALKKLVKKAKIDKSVSFHIARHSFAYNGFKKIKDPAAIQHALKHSKMKETQDYITSLANDQDRDILGEIFN